MEDLLKTNIVNGRIINCSKSGSVDGSPELATSMALLRQWAALLHYSPQQIKALLPGAAVGANVK